METIQPISSQPWHRLGYLNMQNTCSSFPSFLQRIFIKYSPGSVKQEAQADFVPMLHQDNFLLLLAGPAIITGIYLFELIRINSEEFLASINLNELINSNSRTQFCQETNSNIEQGNNSFHSSASW
jgi:hypothetical protein